MITVQRQDEFGTLEASLDDFTIVNEVLRHIPEGTRCLAFIDPYGDTTFNQLQLPVLVDELRLILDYSDESEFSKRVQALLCFVEGATESPHTYIKLIGD